MQSKIPDILIKAIKHENQRYQTIGDYFYDEHGVMQIRVSRFGNRNMQLLVIIHELCEVFLTENNGIKEQDIMNFDVQFEKDRLRGKNIEISEPGDHPDAPYKKEHRFSENIERQLALALGVDWGEYERTLNIFLDHEPFVEPKI